MTAIIKKKPAAPEVKEQRLVYAEVYAPNRPDSDLEFMTPETIQKMAHGFLKAGKVNMVDMNHDNQLVEGATVVESFIARKDDPDFIEGSWVVGMHIDNDEVWSKIKKGELNGFSVQAMVQKDMEEVEIEIPPVISGMTSKSEEHDHQYFVSYDSEGRFAGGRTSTVEGHSHVIRKGTRTESTNGHTHRFTSVDAIKMHR